MKIKTIVLSLLLCFCSLCGVFAFVGCGQASIGDLRNNFEKIEAIYTENISVFVDDTISGVPSSHFVTFGNNVQKKINQKEDGYVQLDEYYNAMFAISCNYIENNKEFILARQESDLNKDSKAALDKLNSAASAYLKALQSFIKERNKFVTYFDSESASANISPEVLEEQNENYLRIFKKSFGNLVSKNITMSLALAKTVETTELFELINDSIPNINDSKTLKEYVALKLLPIFSEFRLTEIDNKFNWNNPHIAGSGKVRVDAILEKLDEGFDRLKTDFVAERAVKALENSTAVTNFYSEIDNFFVASEDYFSALRSYDMQRAALSYDNDLDRYKKVNKLAERYLEKMEQFVNVTLPDFMNVVEETLF